MEPALVRQGFIICHADRARPQPEDVLAEDEWAEEVGRLSMSLMYHRLTRTLWLTVGYPSAAARMLRSPVSAQLEMQKLHADKRAFDMLAEQVRYTPAAQTFYERHVFHMMVNRQLLSASEEANYVMTDDIKEHLTNHFSRIATVQLIDDGFNHQTNNRILSKHRKLARPERAMGMLLSAQVLSRMHHYEELQSPLLCFVALRRSSPGSRLTPRRRR